MSLETTLARAESAAAAEAWRAHERQCHRCASATRQRRRDDLCTPGAGLWTARRARLQELSDAVHLDRQAGPNALKLF